MTQDLNKKELVQKIAADNEITKVAAAEAVEMVTSAIAKTLAAGGSVKLAGFGQFTSKFVEAHERKNNLKAGEMVQVPAGYKFKAKISKTIAE